MNTSNNRRTQETNKQIIETVYRLIEEGKKPLNKITIREVCERAGIHRSTFYAHYRDIYDVVERVEKTMSVKLTEAFMLQLEEGADAENCFVSLFSFIREHRRFYRLYLNETGGAGVIGICTEMFRDRLEALYYRELGYESQEEIDYHGSFILYGMTAMIRMWVNRDCPESPQQFYQILERQNITQKWMMDW